MPSRHARVWMEISVMQLCKFAFVHVVHNPGLVLFFEAQADF